MFIFFINLQDNAFAQNIPVDARFSPKFAEKLKKAHININDLPTKSEISRYELARILNLVECWDCIKPGGWMTDRYTNPYRNNFTQLPGRDFRDIDFQGGLFQDKSYYYCVAYVGDQEYMRGYPVKTSPICAGDFCGKKSVTKAEFIQVVINILEKYSYKDYSVNWTELTNRAKNVEEGKYADQNLTDEDWETIVTASNNCKNNAICPLTSRYEFETYLKYCMFNLKKCGFKPFGRIKQSFRPVSELNIMKKEGLIPLNDHPENDIHSPVDGNYVLQVIGELHKKINCEFVLDYDCDNIENRKDNCPDDYNPNQYDSDGDGIGNVCDDDIDGGGQKNPVGIVDDNNRTITEKRNPNLEKDLFNSDDDNKSLVSPNTQNYITLDIKTHKLKNNKYRFEASVDGKRKNISWNFGDGEIGEGEIVEHNFLEEGTFLITAIAKNNTSTAKANATVIVGQKQQTKAGLYLQSDLGDFVLPLASNVDGEILYNGDEITQKRYVNGEEQTQKNEYFQKIIKSEGVFSISSVLQDKDGNTIAIGQGTIDTNFLSRRGVFLQTDKLEGQIGQDFQFTTQNIGFELEQVSSVVWDFGDGEEENKILNIKKSFDKPGLKVITQKITMKDGNQYFSNLTIYINDKDTSNESKYKQINIVSDQKIKDIGKEFSFQLFAKGINLSGVDSILVDFGDGKTQKISNPDFSDGMFVKHNYTSDGYFYPKFNIIGKNCLKLNSQLTIYVKGVQDKCIQAKQNGTLMQEFHCDMDGDQIPDICDSDIDGDGKQNPMGLILFEKSDCSLQLGNHILNQSDKPLTPDQKENIKPNIIENSNKGDTNVSWEIFNYLYNCDLDTCPFVNNIDDLSLGDTSNNFKKEYLDCEICEPSYPRNKSKNLGDKDQDGIPDDGDLENKDQNGVPDDGDLEDKDQDGITDNKDRCINIPGNGSEDGCPKINNDKCYKGPKLNIGKVAPSNCRQCPCQFADFGGDLNPQDIVRAVLMDTGGNFEYTWSFPYKIFEK